MREIHDHKVNPANDTLSVFVIDKPGSGGANHAYLVTGLDIDKLEANPAAQAVEEEAQMEGYPIIFQNGPISEVGVNGVTHEVLLAVLADRLTGFQSGPYASVDNAEALSHIQAAQQALQRRTRERMARGVEGTHKV